MNTVLPMPAPAEAVHAECLTGAILQIVCSAGEAFLRCSDWREVAPAVVEEVCKCLGADRGYLLRNQPGVYEVIDSMVYSWVAPGICPRIGHGPRRRFSYEASGLNRWAQTLLSGQVLKGRFDEFNSNESSYLASEGVSAIICLPVFVRGIWWGTLSFDDCRDDRNWQVSDVRALQQLAAVLGAAIERCDNERSITASETRYRLLIENLGEGVAYVDPTEHFTFANPAAEAIFGVPKGRLVGRSLLDFVAVELQGIIQNEANLRRDNRKSRYQHEIVRADGVRRALEVTATPRFDKDGLFLGTFAIFSDITDRKIQESQLGLLAHALKSATDQVCVLDTSGTILFANESFVSGVGSAGAGVEGRRLADVLGRDAALEQVLALTLANGSWRGEIAAKCADGSEKPLILSTSVVPDENGKACAVVGVSRDISERKRAEEEAAKRAQDLEQAKTEAENANRAKSEFLAQMSHEIRTPMNGVIGMAGLLIETHLTAEQREYAEAIRASADSLLSIINDILDLSKVEAGKMKLEPVPFDIIESLQATGDFLGHNAKAKGLKYKFSSNVPSRWVSGDLGRIRQIVVNLLGNAIKFTDKGTVRLEINEMKVPADLKGFETAFEIAIEDSGIGIAPEKLNTLFRKFGQLDASTSRRHQGTGLGLAISRQLAELMGGDITVTSREGQGSRFVFRLNVPVSTPQVTERSAPLPEDARPVIRKRRVLLAEDNVVNQRVASRLLEKLGCTVDIAANGREAVHMSLRFPYDIIFMDCMMPEMDGYAASREIRTSDLVKGAIPIVALTAHAVTGAREQCLEAGMDDYITKPVSRSAIERALLMWTPW